MSYKKRYLLVVLLGLGFGRSVWAQQEHAVYQYIQAVSGVNPAFAGSQDIQLNLVHQSQWRGFVEGLQYSQLNTSIPVLHNSMGLGLNWSSWNVPGSQIQELAIPVSYRIRLRNFYASFGLSSAIRQWRVDFSDFDKEDENDPTSALQFGKWNPAFHFGGALYNESTYIGVSVRHLTRTIISQGGPGAKLRMSRHVVFVGRHRFPLTSNMALEGGVFIRYLDQAPLYYFPQLRVWLKESIMLGSGYTSAKEINFQLGLRFDQLMQSIPHPLTVSYAFQQSTGVLQSINNGSHEISLNYNFQPRPSLKKIKEQNEIISPIIR